MAAAPEWNEANRPGDVEGNGENEDAAFYPNGAVFEVEEELTDDSSDNLTGVKETDPMILLPFVDKVTPSWNEGIVLQDKATIVGVMADVRSCPYDPSHTVSVGKYAAHLWRCRKNHPELAADIVICKYNRTHHVRASNRALHFQVCPDKNRHMVDKPPVPMAFYEDMMKEKEKALVESAKKAKQVQFSEEEKKERETIVMNTMDDWC